MTFGTGLAVDHRDQDVRRLDVAVDDPLLMGMLDRLTDLDERGQASSGRQLLSIAELGDRHSPDQFHHEVRAPGPRAAGIQDPRDVRVVHQGQGLAFCLEPGNHVARVHSRLENLQRDLAADGLGLLGNEDQAEPTLTDLLHQPVRPDPVANFRGRRASVGRVVIARDSQVGRRPVQRVVSGMSREQRLDFSPERRVPRTSFFQVRRPVGGRGMARAAAKTDSSVMAALRKGSHRDSTHLCAS